MIMMIMITMITMGHGTNVASDRTMAEGQVQLAAPRRHPGMEHRNMRERMTELLQRSICIAEEKHKWKTTRFKRNRANIFLFKRLDGGTCIDGKIQANAC